MDQRWLSITIYTQSVWDLGVYGEPDVKYFKSFDRGKSQEYSTIFQDFSTEKAFERRRQMAARTPKS